MRACNNSPEQFWALLSALSPPPQTRAREGPNEFRQCSVNWKRETLGFPVVPFYPFLGEGSPTKIDYRKKSGTLILTSLLEDLDTHNSCGLDSGSS